MQSTQRASSAPHYPRTRRVLIRLLGAIGWVYFSFYHRWQRKGVANIPRHGPLVIIINHTSGLDTPLLGTILILNGFIPGLDIFTPAKRELFDKPIFSTLLPWLGLFPLDRDKIDVNAMRQFLEVVRSGQILGIAPEGTRSATGQLQRFQPGVAKLAISRRVAILPVGIVGAEKAMPIGSHIPRPAPLEVRFGPVFELSSYYGMEQSPATLARAADEMRAHVAALLPEWMRELPVATTESGSDAYHPALFPPRP